MRARVGLLALLLLAGCAQREGSEVGVRAGNIDLERLSNAHAEPGQWLTLGRTWKADRYSPLTQIDVENAGRLGFAWEYAARTRRGRVEVGHEATPIVVDGIMYASGPWGAVYAVDARTGEERWRYDPDVDGSYWRRACCGAVNRGLQVWKGRVYVGTLDGHLVSLDAATGKELWKVDTLIDRDKRSYTITGPAQIAKNVVVIGNSGAEFGVRGYVTAYDLETGEQRWRFFTVPRNPAEGPPEHPEMELALQTWDPDSHWESGLGGTVWGEMVYDPELDLLYVGTGNSSPYPIWHRSPRGGDNLFLASILALDPDTGRMAWYYQTTPGEIWDYTATQNMILAELDIDGRTRKVIMQAPKNGFFYVLDRETGEFISGTPYARQNWAEGLDERGRPIVIPGLEPSEAGVLVYPHWAGAANWHSPAYSPLTGLFYQNTREMGSYFFKGDNRYVPGKMFEGGSFRPVSEEAYGAVRALDALSGKLKWEYRIPSPPLAGLLATAGGLVFGGMNENTFFALDADTGELLWEYNVGGAVRANPISYAVDGKQYVMISAGTTFFAFALP